MDMAPSHEYLDPWQEAIRHLPNPDPDIAQYQQAINTNYSQWKEASVAYRKSGDFLRSLEKAEESAVQYARSLTLNQWNVEGILSSLQEALSSMQEALSLLQEPEHTMARIQTMFEEANRPDLYLEWGIRVVP
jgi:hypothetical protein